jgi:calcium-dependent protein kinase
MMKLLMAINHCHSWGVIHRDIKPENIMYDKDGEIKLIDFGLSRIIEEQKSRKALHTYCGTLAYMAPEVLSGTYNKECDIWSLGVLLYVLVSGYLPFQGQNRNKIMLRIQTADFHFKHKEFDKVSEECKSLLKKMLVAKPSDRITAKQAL